MNIADPDITAGRDWNIVIATSTVLATDHSKYSILVAAAEEITITMLARKSVKRKSLRSTKLTEQSDRAVAKDALQYKNAYA